MNWDIYSFIWKKIISPSLMKQKKVEINLVIRWKKKQMILHRNFFFLKMNGKDGEKRWGTRLARMRSVCLQNANVFHLPSLQGACVGKQAITKNIRICSAIKL